MTATFDGGLTPADRLRAHAGEADHLYAHLMRAMASDWEAGGPVRDVYAGHEGSPQGSVLQLRLLAGLFRIVLTDRAPELVPFYPCLGGTASATDAWPVVREVLGRHVDELREALEVAPQTNEVGRSNALLVGIFEAVRRTGLTRLRLLEPGASAGLNLLVDRFRFVNPDWAFGPADSPLVLRDAVVGDIRPVAFEVAERRGCDLAPVDASSAAGRLRLRSFVWPFDVDRHERLASALKVAADHPVTVDRGGAGEWLEQRLAEPVDDDVLTVVWHSVTRMYWPAVETNRVEAAVAEGARRIPLAHVAMEHSHEGAESAATLTLAVGRPGHLGSWPEPVRLATVGDHGVPVTVA